MNLAAEPIPPAILALPTALVEGRRVVRLSGQIIGWERLDAVTAESLSRDGLGWLVGGHPSVRVFASLLKKLDSLSTSGLWVVIPHSNELAEELASLFVEWGAVKPAVPLCWRSRRVCVATPERLRSTRSIIAGESIAGIIVLDWPCVMHCRFGRPLQTAVRPQLVVNFRALHATASYLPPLLIVTNKQLAAIDPEPIRRVYCLEQFHYIDGVTFGYCNE